MDLVPVAERKRFGIYLEDENLPRGCNPVSPENVCVCVCDYIIRGCRAKEASFKEMAARRRDSAIWERARGRILFQINILGISAHKGRHTAFNIY